MRIFSCTLLADGSSDSVLMPLLRKLLDEHCPYPFDLQFAEGLSAAVSPLAQQMERAVNAYPCDLLFVHRDAEKEDPQVRQGQIEEALMHSGVQQKLVPVVPVRMTEAWLLVDEAAIRSAARNPRGTAALALPKPSKIESMPEPKEALFNALRTASELTGRRLSQFHPQAQRHRVTEHLESIAPLRDLPSFARLEAQLRDVFHS
jgi:hypothetical protein